MPVRSSDEYRASLRDGRTVWYRGRRVDDVTAVPELRVAVDHAALDFDVGHDPEFRDLAIAKDPDSGEEYSAYYRIPRCADDLLARSSLIETVTAVGGTLVTLVKEIGSDALFGLLRVLDGEAASHVRAYYERCRDDDLAVAVAQTDVKGDRSLPPHAQPDPDLYVHVVDEQADGVVVRGAKTHTSTAVNANEIIVLPTRAMGAGDSDYAIAFAVPVNTPGLTLYVSPYGAEVRDAFEFPVSHKHAMLETLTVFDDVFVPWERVFACRQPELAGPIALAFVEYHRFTAVSYKLPLVDALVGSAALIAVRRRTACASSTRSAT
jgi:aromatic ring hydroxylase